MHNTLKVANHVQKVLFEREITGQLSDGAWENSNPMNHWMAWSNAKVVVDEVVQGRNFYAQKDNYRLSSLIEYVGDRMITYAKIAIAFPALAANDNVSIPNDLEYKDYHEKIESYRKFWMIVAATGLSREKFAEKINSVEYTEKDLREDLRGLSKAMKKITK